MELTYSSIPVVKDYRNTVITLIAIATGIGLLVFLKNKKTFPEMEEEVSE